MVDWGQGFILMADWGQGFVLMADWGQGCGLQWPLGGKQTDFLPIPRREI